jgi:rRNA maturation RNase YbeY
MPVSFQNADISFRLPHKALLKKFIADTFLRETKKKLSVTYVFCSDEYLLKINQDFLSHDYYTDIITFPLADTDQKTEAEIYVSIDRIKENAEKLKVDFDQELLRVVFHGVLHLAGLKDKTAIQKTMMRKAEEKWIRAFAKSNKLIA